VKRQLKLALGLFLLVTLAACGPTGEEQAGDQQAEATTAAEAEPAANAGSFSGSYLGNDREAKLEFLHVVTMDKWDEPAWTILVSEKAPRPNSSWDSGCQYGDYGDALMVTITETGGVIGTQICHQEFAQGFSASGVLNVEPFAIENGVMKAHVATREEQEFSDVRYSIDLDLEVTLP
jgi:hypothetical protein